MLKSIEFDLVYPLYLAGFQVMIVWEGDEFPIGLSLSIWRADVRGFS